MLAIRSIPESLEEKHINLRMDPASMSCNDNYDQYVSRAGDTDYGQQQNAETKSYSYTLDVPLELLGLFYKSQ